MRECSYGRCAGLLEPDNHAGNGIRSNANRLDFDDYAGSCEQSSRNGARRDRYREVDRIPRLGGESFIAELTYSNPGAVWLYGADTVAGRTL